MPGDWSPSSPKPRQPPRGSVRRSKDCATAAVQKRLPKPGRMSNRRRPKPAMIAANSIVSQQDLENAKAALDVAEAKLASSQKALDLTVAGPRNEDIGQAEAQLRADEAQSALLRQELADTQLIAPMDAVVRTRLMEPGEMASPQKPVFSLAIADPKWVRAYVSEMDLAKLHPGMKASIAID